MSQTIRLQAIEPSRSYLVQAPAGSGKTELLTQRILALLAIVDEPEEILALTFTRKAAAEMSNRVMDALTMAKPADDLSHKMATWVLADKALARSREREWNLPDHPARLRIMTLDSLTGALARQLPLLSGLGDMPTPSEHAKAAYREAAETLLDRAIKNENSAVETLLLHQDHNAVALIELIAQMLGNREQWLIHLAAHGRDRDGLKALLQSNLGEWMGHQIELVDAAIPPEAKAALPALIRFAGAQLEDETLLNFHAWPTMTSATQSAIQPTLEQIAAWKLLANFLLTREAQLKKSLTVAHGFPPAAKSEKQQMQALLALLTNIPGLAESLHQLRNLPDSPAFNPDQWQVVEALFELLPQAVTELQSTFGSQGEADFTEISLRALDALNDLQGNPSDLLLKMDYRIQHLLIDEFQDTSELQIRLLRCLTSGWQPDDGRTLFMVGDPMQSIYRFRKAEVGLFLQAAANEAGLPPVTELKLERNFRSSPAIVEWVNHAFKTIFPAKQDAVSGAIAHANALPARAHAGSVALHLLENSGDRDNDDAAEAATVLALVKQAVDQGQRVGILSRTRKHLHAIMHALTEAGLPFRAINILPLHSRAEIRALRALLRALLHPADRESWLALLRSACCGLTTPDLFTLLAGHSGAVWQAVQANDTNSGLSEDARKRINHLQQALTPCMEMSGRIAARTLIETAWQRLGMPSLLEATASANVTHFLELIEALDKNGRVDFSLLDERIETLFAAPDSSAQAARVELMTMHGAKGLQWDVVILPGLGKASKGSDQPLLAFTDLPMHGRSLFLLSPKAETRSDDRLFSLVQAIENGKERHETARLLYVACTRAETALHLLGDVSGSSGEAKKGSLLQLLTQNDPGCFGAEINTIEPVIKSDSGQRRLLQRMKEIPPPLPETKRESVQEPEYGWAGPEAAPVGNALHAMLQQIAEIGIETWNLEQAPEAERRMQRMLMAEGLSGKLLDSALSRCTLALAKTVNSKLGQWILDAGHQDSRCEWPLSFMQNGQLCQRVIDRSFIDDEGTRWIIDYKTGSHEGGDLNAFLDSEQERYSRQLEGYRTLLEKMDGGRSIKIALYFPAFDGWREIPLNSGASTEN